MTDTEHSTPAPTPVSEPEGWRPIGTAPKDGTPVVLLRPRSSSGKRDTVVIGRWVDDATEDDERIRGWCWYEICGDIFCDEDFSEAVAEDSVFVDVKNFTHWLPLPVAPDITPRTAAPGG